MDDARKRILCMPHSRHHAGAHGQGLGGPFLYLKALSQLRDRIQALQRRVHVAGIAKVVQAAAKVLGVRCRLHRRLSSARLQPLEGHLG